MNREIKSFVFPGNIEPEILEIASKQIPYMRTEWFSNLVLECEKLLLSLIDCPDGRVIPYTASGTAAMESCVANFVSTSKRALVVNGGTFGARWENLCVNYNIPYDEFPVEFGCSPDMVALTEQIKSKNYDVLLMQHHETSSGYLYDLQPISKICRDNNMFFVVDAISSFLADELSMKKLGADIIILSSQKGLNLPPGLSFLILTNRIIELNNYGHSPLYYNWGKHLSDLSRGQTPYSPATHLFMQLHARLKKIENLGVENVIKDVALKASCFRDMCKNQGWKFSATKMSNCITGVYLPFIVRPLIDDFAHKKIYVMPCSIKNMIRVAHLGTLTYKDYVRLVEDIVEWQKKQ